MIYGLLKRIAFLVTLVRFFKRVKARLRRLSGAQEKQGKRSVSGISFIHTEQSNFCGYYDHSPFNKSDEALLLIHQTSSVAWRRPSPSVPVKIVVYDWKANRPVSILGESSAWNWQQGSRAMWYDDNSVLFNVFDQHSREYRARLVDLSGRLLSEMPIPIQELDSKGRVYSLSYEALALIRPDYGYRNRRPTIHDLDNNSIRRFDPVSGGVITLVAMAELKPCIEIRLGHSISSYKFNHLMASPDAESLVFLVRYICRAKRVTDLYHVSTDGGAPQLILADCNASHMCWLDSDSILITLAGPVGFGYYRVQFNTDGPPTLVHSYSDGHPSRLASDKFLTDTYPDEFGFRRLLVCSQNSGDRSELAVFSEPLLFQGETRCDLHPSLSPSRKYIQVDCAKDHRRRIAVLKNPVPGMAI